MAINSIEISQPLSRTDLLLFPFAKKRKQGGGAQPPRRPTTSASPTPPPNPEEGFKFGRRLGIALGTVGALGVTAGLLRPWEYLSKPELKVIPEVDLYYPELKPFTLYASGELKTGRSSTKWFNFTKANFDPAVAKATFEFFERLAQEQPNIVYKLENSYIPTSLGARVRINRLIFIIPDKAPTPKWKDTDVATDGMTTGQVSGGYNIFVRYHDSNATIPPSPAFSLDTNRLAFTKTFATEAFQSSILVSSLTPAIATLMQEIIANSYSAAFASKQRLNTTYATYVVQASRSNFRLDETSPSYSAYVLSEKEFDAIPTPGLLVK